MSSESQNVIPVLKSFEIHNSKSGHKTPIVNGIHLHSTYNPIKEASTFVKKYEELLKTKKYFLVLGLGFGYHILQAIYKIRENTKNFKMIIIEPFEEVTQSCLNLKLIDPNECEIITAKKPKEIYENYSLVELLLNSPGILAHTASFNLSSDYFKEILTYKAAVDTKSISENINDNNLKNYLDSFKEGTNFNDLMNSVSRQKISLDESEIKIRLLNSIIS